jgi:allantoate deiminase
MLREPSVAPGSSGDAEQQRPTPNLGRLAADLQQLAALGATPDGGVTRLAYTPLERQAHDLVAQRMREAGLDVHVDPFGNTIGVRPGRRSDAPAIAAGSHLDSVPNGGQFDGTVGVLSALEVMRLLREQDIETAHPLWLVVFAAEEGARFGAPCLGSKAVAGLLTPADAARLRDAQGISLAEAMRSVGCRPELLGQPHWSTRDVAAFLEVHIEQARVLETEERPIGLVDGVAGNTRLRVTITGRTDHSGSTPMHLRRDALVAAAEIILGVEALACDPRRRSTVATVGRIEAEPNTLTTVPGRVVLGVDVRDVDSDRQRAVAWEVAQLAQRVGERRGMTVNIELITDSSPAVLPMWLRQHIAAVCRDLGIDFRVLNSGAGHDAAIVARVAPAAMIFIPSRDGASHSPLESSSLADIGRGVEVLYHTILRLDQVLTELEQASQS